MVAPPGMMENRSPAATTVGRIIQPCEHTGQLQRGQHLLAEGVPSWSQRYRPALGGGSTKTGNRFFKLVGANPIEGVPIEGNHYYPSESLNRECFEPSDTHTLRR